MPPLGLARRRHRLGALARRPDPERQLARSLIRPCGKGKAGPIKVEEVVELGPMPFLKHWSPERRRQWFCDTIRDVEGRNATADDANKDARSVYRNINQNPHETPATSEPRRRLYFTPPTPPNAKRSDTPAKRRRPPTATPPNDLRRGDYGVVFRDDCFPRRT